MSMWLRATALWLAALVVVGCGASGDGNSANRGSNDGKVTLIAFVGAASKPPTSDAKEAFERANPDIAIAMTFGGSGTLLNQMTLEETGDIYMPGSDDYMEKAEEQGVVLPETRGIAAYLVPAICVQKGNPKGIRSLEDLARPGLTVGLAQAEAVCLGDVSLEILRSAGLEQEVLENVITFAPSCDQTQHLVELGEVDAILGWDAFAKWAPDQIGCVRIAREHVRVRSIPVAVSRYSEHPEAAQRFINFLTSDQGKAIFAKHGYCVEPPTI